jgi:hypothetical protein
MKVVGPWPWLCALSLAMVAGPAWAAEGSKGASEAIFIAQIVVLMVVGRLLGETMQRLRQPAVMGQLMAGLLLGHLFLACCFRTPSTLCFRRAPNRKR